ncbi:MAG: glycosyltransferase, partial [Candidatus Jordarchaeum sp.]|uniref:glycosyltransferase n=1 Tax=Candidatus Jordarchaeum sp. TaxID=2823881 RepID=UPI0040499B75
PNTIWKCPRWVSFGQRFADRVIQLLETPKLAEEMGRKGKEFVRKNFLITRLLLDYLILLNDMIQ